VLPGPVSRFCFFVQRSSDTTHLQQLRGLDGETCYCLLVCHFSGMLFGEPFCSKAPPVDFLNRWLVRYGLPSDISTKYVCMDQGGELGRCPDVLHLFEAAGYVVELTAPDSSHQNGPGKCPHHTFGDAVHTMLVGARLEARFWPYAFCHFIRLYNVTPHCSHDASLYTLCSGHLPDLSLLCTFGCRVYVLPPHALCRNKLQSDTHVGIFLGYSHTLKNILYYNTASHHVKTAFNIVFDEAMTDSDAPSPNAHLLCGQSVLPTNVIDVSSGLPLLDISSTPFTTLLSVSVRFDPDAPLPFGFELATCPVFGMFTLHPSHDLLLTIPYELLITLFLVLILSPSPIHLSSLPMMLIHLLAIFALLVHLPLSSHWFLLRSIVRLLMIALPLLIFAYTIFVILRPYGR